MEAIGSALELRQPYLEVTQCGLQLCSEGRMLSSMELWCPPLGDARLESTGVEDRHSHEQLPVSLHVTSLLFLVLGREAACVRGDPRFDRLIPPLKEAVDAVVESCRVGKLPPLSRCKPSMCTGVCAAFMHAPLCVGLRKPDPAIYELMCQQLCVAPHRVVFLDDIKVSALLPCCLQWSCGGTSLADHSVT